MSTRTVTELFFKNTQVNFESFEINNNILTLNIVNSLVCNIDLIIDKFVNLKSFTLEPNNEVVFPPYIFTKIRFTYVKFNKNVIIGNVLIYDIIECHRKFILNSYVKRVNHVYFLQDCMTFIHDSSMLIIIEQNDHHFDTKNFSPNIKKLCIYYNSLNSDKSFLEELPIELEELTIFNLRYDKLSNLPSSLKKINFDWSQSMIGYETKEKDFLNNIILKSKFPFGCQIISRFLNV